METVECRLADITIKDRSEDHTAHITVPAFTRTDVDLHMVVESHIAQYFKLSEKHHQPVSLADLAVWLLVQAAKEPRTIEGDK